MRALTELHRASDVNRREWLPLGDVGDEPAHVTDIAYAEWQRHVEPHESLPAVSRAVAQVALHLQQLDAAVLDARQRGLSWGKIGTAVGVSHQVAHERWGPCPRGSSEAEQIDGGAESRPRDSRAAGEMVAIYLVNRPGSGGRAIKRGPRT